jgi:hypothetical protein
MMDSVYYLLHADFFLGLAFSPEDGGDMFLRNVDLTFSGIYGIKSKKSSCLREKNVF